MDRALIDAQRSMKTTRFTLPTPIHWADLPDDQIPVGGAWCRTHYLQPQNIAFDNAISDNEVDRVLSEVR